MSNGSVKIDLRKHAGHEPSRRGSMASGAMLAGAVVVLALPSAVLAFASNINPLRTEAPSQVNSFTSTPADARLATVAPIRSLAQGHLYRFTPASTSTRADRSVTVAVRVDPETVQAITVRGNRIIAQAAPSAAPQLRLAPTAFTLGVSRGYQSFAQAIVPPADIRKIEMPDLATFRAGGGAAGAPSRFSPRITLDDREAAGRAPRTFAGDKDPLVDVGGAYRVTRNLNVTAGVRYSQDRERLQSLTDGKQDNQAVYVGTQFRF